MKAKHGLTALIVSAALAFPAMSLEDNAEKHEALHMRECVPKEYSVGDSQVVFQLCGDLSRDSYVLTAMHRDETTGIGLALEEGPNLIYLSDLIPGKKERWVRFTLDNDDRVSFKVDPNRIFSYDGARESLERNTLKWDKVPEEMKEKAIGEAVKLGDAMTSMLEGYNGIISLHNNQNNGMTVNTFKGESYEAKSGGKVHVTKKKDPDDFFFVTREKDFDELKGRGYNVVLQETGEMGEDGSLSWWSYSNNIPYINVEVQYSHKKIQKEMLDVAKELILKP
ncbi:MAG: hypothetical protein ABIB71_07770 [Candidatus Woesearchaeota archaeon]